MICSALIPSRARPEKLKRCIESIRSTSDKDNVEIIVRIDDDDSSSKAIVDEITDGFGVRMIVGPRGRGWTENASMFDEMVAIQNGDWCWFLNDDAIIEGEGWDTLLQSVPNHGYIVHPETYGLGASRYTRCAGGPFPMVPKNCWQKYGHKELVHPVDTWLDSVLVHQRNWKNRFLNRVSFLHDRDDDGAIIQHRKQ